ncbi:MAG: YXWGXW repeat-containing protein, partial [Nevskia sp.]|nr:YXWGXW repeat-containing protein [Nevskia sp.]
MKKLACSCLLAIAALAAAGPAAAGVFISVNIAPPPLPVYEQPPCPAPDYIWIPGYWAWDPDVGAYYWVPGTWVLAPRPGLLWTPGWWGWSAGVYVWHPGYWAPHVGFYGGINYGFGYFGTGFVGGYWSGPHFYYNQVVNNVNVTVVRNVYVNKTVIENVTVNRVSYNGPGGIQRRPLPDELAVERERHWQPTQEQVRQVAWARENRAQFVGARGAGHPQVFATPRPGAFAGHEAHAPPGTGHGPAAPVVTQRPQAPMTNPAPMPPRVVEPRVQPHMQPPIQRDSGPSIAHPQPMPRLEPRIEPLQPQPREDRGERPPQADPPRIVERPAMPPAMPQE